MLLSYMCQRLSYSTSQTVWLLMSQYFTGRPMASHIEQLMPATVLHMV